MNKRMCYNTELTFSCPRCFTRFLSKNQCTIVPLIHLEYEKGRCCNECFEKIKNQFITFLLCLGRTNVIFPREMRNMILMHLAATIEI
jgi:hypothetical protein